MELARYLKDNGLASVVDPAHSAGASTPCRTLTPSNCVKRARYWNHVALHMVLHRRKWDERQTPCRRYTGENYGGHPPGDYELAR
jgi:hypothetical protein